MTPQQFVAKWQRANLSERSACQQHFCDLCDLLGQPKPAEADPDGTWYTFERGVRKVEGDHGWADVWKRGCFGWEYKRKHRDLVAAYRQLLLYREDLENPPLLVVCDLDRFEIHTNFTGTVKQIYAFDLAGISEGANLAVLRNLFANPDALRPQQTPEEVTEEAAARFAELADGMRLRGISADRAAHFLMKLMFCMFGEDIGLLRNKVFERLLKSAKERPDTLPRRLGALFAAMAKGGDFGADAIDWFNGGLFADADVIPLNEQEVNIVAAVNDYDWSNVEPSIFGTLFERTLDPQKRAQIGAHYTSRADIEVLLGPVLLAPLRREWAAVKQRCETKLWPAVEKVARKEPRVAPHKATASKQRKAYEKALQDFAERLQHVTVLDPACGSGNFLYVAINLLLDLEKEVVAYAAAHGLPLIPHVRPSQLLGLEINPYAQQLAQVVVWIGYLQWMHHNGFKTPSNPILEPIETIQCMDSIVDESETAHPNEPDWPAAEVIVGNPPFLGGKLLRTNFGDRYVDAMFRVWDGRVPREADLCCYWFEKARAQIEKGKCRRAGLLATQGIRGGANRKVLQQIKQSGNIFFAESDRDWVLDGAAVHVSMIGFDGGEEQTCVLDGQPAAQIHANLAASAADTTTARRLDANLNISFMGDTKGGAFDIDEPAALEMLRSPNPHGRPNSDVVVPWVNGLDVTRRLRNMWIIDFGVEMPVEQASRYEEPMKGVDRDVRPERAKNKRESYRDKWWIHVEPRPAMRVALGTKRFLATTTVSKHRLFVWMESPILPDHQLIVFSRCDDYFFGVLHSCAHELWARAQGTQVREVESGFRYTPTSCFETFPFPNGSQEHEGAIARAASELEALRSTWLNPPEWTMTEVLEFPGTVAGPWSRFVHDANKQGTGTVRWPRLVPRDPHCAESLKKRTLTNLYNQRPTWLDQAHRALDAAVMAAYGWPADLPDEEILKRLLELNRERAREA